MTNLELFDEQQVLAAFLDRPEDNRWELDGITVDLFANVVHREIAEALIKVRNSGQRIHWRRVRRELKTKGRREAWAFVPLLVRYAGPRLGITAAMSRIVQLRAARAA